MFEQAKRKNKKLQKEIDSLRAENRQLKDKLFAAKSEKKPSKDRSNRLDNPKAGNGPRRSRGHLRRKRYRRTRDCPNVSQTLIAPAPAKLIPKGR